MLEKLKIFSQKLYKRGELLLLISCRHQLLHIDPLYELRYVVQVNLEIFLLIVLVEPLLLHQAHVIKVCIEHGFEQSQQYSVRLGSLAQLE